MRAICSVPEGALDSCHGRVVSVTLALYVCYPRSITLVKLEYFLVLSRSQCRLQLLTINGCYLATVSPLRSESYGET